MRLHHFCLALCLHSASSRLLHSLPEDTHAFPKFSVAFINSLPVLNQTAARWLNEGLHGGHLEFMDQPWKPVSHPATSQQNAIESGLSQHIHVPSASDGFTLELMRLGPRDSYVCLIPKPLDHVPSSPGEQSDAEITPARSWALLQPLVGTCLYHTHGWFTYSYCHDQEIRQFKELETKQPRLTGSYIPEEDPEWEAYTLGRAPAQPQPGADLTPAQRNAHATNLELAKTAGSRYLVQRWGDGTLCDKTGKPREVEVQFHCSMTTTDSILFVKETKTCSYVLVINTPRLCGEPGFKSRRDAAEEAPIRCREIVDSLPEETHNFPITDFPMKGPSIRKPKLPASMPTKEQEVVDETDTADILREQKQAKIVNDLLQQILDLLMKNKLRGKGNKIGESTEVVIELAEGDEQSQEVGDKLREALRAAGYNIKSSEFLGLKADKALKNKAIQDNENKKQRGAGAIDDDDDNDDVYVKDEP